MLSLTPDYLPHYNPKAAVLNRQWRGWRVFRRSMPAPTGSTNFTIGPGGDYERGGGYGNDAKPGADGILEITEYQ